MFIERNVLVIDEPMRFMFSLIKFKSELVRRYTKEDALLGNELWTPALIVKDTTLLL